MKAQSPRESNCSFLHAAGIQLRLHLTFSVLSPLLFLYPSPLPPYPKPTLRSLHYKELESGMGNPSVAPDVGVFLIIYIYNLLLLLETLPGLPPTLLFNVDFVQTIQSKARQETSGIEERFVRAWFL